MKRGIIQSRGLGDIIIALPIARYYYEQGDEIHWPVCEEFLSSVEKYVPWIKWHKVTTDPQGLFFYDEPVRILQEQGVDLDESFYLYQFLSSMPELTEPEMYAMLKFDQYKYWTSGVPFLNKWTLGEFLERNSKAEAALIKTLSKDFDLNQPFGVLHRRGSNCQANVDLTMFENLAIEQWIDVDNYTTSSIFDWIAVLERSSAFIGLDSAFANLVDCLKLDIPNKFWIRRSGWDLTPVLGSAWVLVPNPQNLDDPQRIKPWAAAEQKQKQRSGLTTSLPFASNSGYPTSFMHAVKQGGPSGNVMMPGSKPQQ